MPQTIQRYRGDNNKAGDDLLHPIGQLHFGAAVVDDRHDQRADQAAEHGSFAAG